MSKTYRDIVRGRYNRKKKEFYANKNNYEQHCYKVYRYNPEGRFMFDKSQMEWRFYPRIKQELQDKTPWDLLTHDEQCKIFRGYGKNPGWWNRLYGMRPNRRYTKVQLERYIGVKIPDYDIEDNFYGRRIHCDYYW